MAAGVALQANSFQTIWGGQGAKGGQKKFSTTSFLSPRGAVRKQASSQPAGLWLLNRLETG